MPYQVSQNYRTGKIALTEVGAPALQPGGMIVRSHFSVVSPGTEGTKLKEAKLSLVEKARARPDQVKQVLAVAGQLGLRAAYQKVINRLEQLTPLGYSLSGRVVAVADDVSDFSVGDMVAAGGAGLANHAEYNFIPRNLAVAIPDGVKVEYAAFTTIGSIAMHAFRQGAPMLGETALVIGLGLVGQLLLQILVAGGVRAVGIDLDDERCSLARSAGAIAAGTPNSLDWQQPLRETGADCVFIVAGSQDNGLLELAARHVRDRGRIVVVGKTALGLDYNTFFKKEIDVRFSRSYGPGRFDPSYELKGHDYPLPYVRWTEGRNMAAFLDLLARQQLKLESLLQVMRPFSASVDTYEAIYERQIQSLGIAFDYGVESERPAQRVIVRSEAKQAAAAGIGVIGAGNYAASMLLPELKADKRVNLGHVVTASGLSAAGIAQRFGFASHGTDANAVFADPSIGAVVIATRHSTHAALVAEALTAGKAVFVEKPLAIDDAGLALVRKAMKPNSRLLVGFNRRYSPALRRLHKLSSGAGPLHMLYRVQAGPLPDDAWQWRPEEGGRFVGEAGHFFDVFQFLAQSRPIAVQAMRLHPPQATPEHDCSITATVRYANGSVGTLVYDAVGGQRIAKEYLEVHGGGCSWQMKNFESLEISSGTAKTKTERGFAGKGQQQQMQEFIDALATGREMPIDFTVLADVTQLTLDAARAAVADGVIRHGD